MVEFIYVILCLVFIIAPIGTFFHEFGHSLAARTIRANEINLKIGKGKRVLSFTILRINVDIHLLFFIGGQASSSRIPFYKKEELVYITLLGPLTNAVIAFLLYLFSSYEPNIYIELAFWYNVWLFVVNILPIRYDNKTTDGYIVYKLLFRRLD